MTQKITLETCLPIRTFVNIQITDNASHRIYMFGTANCFKEIRLIIRKSYYKIFWVSKYVINSVCQYKVTETKQIRHWLYKVLWKTFSVRSNILFSILKISSKICSVISVCVNGYVCVCVCHVTWAALRLTIQPRLALNISFSLYFSKFWRYRFALPCLSYTLLLDSSMDIIILC